MDWLQSKGAQIVGLVSILGTLAGFGYTGATYVNRIENLEAKVSALSIGEDEADDGIDAIEERFGGIETSVEYINKTIDDTLIPDVKNNSSMISVIDVDVATINTKIESIESQVDKLENKDDNPLAR
tara:strand:+ start:251 stop:631 length:381 start_codon:yes stop_codon:yes gene_type:complete